MNKNTRPKNQLKPKAHFEWVFMDIIPETPTKPLTSETTFSNYIFIVDAYSKIQKLYGMDIITTEEVVDKLDMFLARSGNIDKFGW